MDGHRILPGVPAMWYGNPSAVCFIGAVMRLMEYIGDPVEQDELMALSGVGLCFPWQFASPCDEVGIFPEIPAHTFEVLGYESAYLNGEAMGGGGRWIDEIKRSIDRGRPVIGFGITVDMPMACLIAGYDAGGLYVRAFWPPEGERPDSEDYF